MSKKFFLALALLGLCACKKAVAPEAAPAADAAPAAEAPAAPAAQ
jgi:hypothetical protein